jgi:hypothetical protein
MSKPNHSSSAAESSRTSVAPQPGAAAGQPAVGDFIQPPDLNPDAEERSDALPEQEAFWKPPVRFGSVPVEQGPLGWDRRRGFRKLFPAVYLPFQVVERVRFGHPALEPSRLIWGDNLHVMRQFASESIDPIYIAPPFFSGRQDNDFTAADRSASDTRRGFPPGREPSAYPPRSVQRGR